MALLICAVCLSNERQWPLVHDAFHDDRRRQPVHAGQGRELLVAEDLVGDKIRRDDAQQVIGIAEEPLGAPHRGDPTKLHRLEENMAAADLELSPDDLREIEEAQIEAKGARYSEANQRMIDR
jgi:hypothetical protein